MARTRLILSWKTYGLESILQEYVLGRTYKPCSMVLVLVAVVLLLLVGSVIVFH
jgi:succinate dehydrogenase hydrophobic anchor subunit